MGLTLVPANLLEVADGESPNHIRANIRDGKAQFRYVILNEGPTTAGLEAGDDITAADLRAFIPTIFGTTVPGDAGGSGRTQRTLPLAHPIIPSYRATGIADLRGVGPKRKSLVSEAFQGIPGQPTIPYHVVYKNYILDLEFEQLPYSIFPDNQVRTDAVTGYSCRSGTAYNFTSQFEWERFTDYRQDQAGQAVTAKQGQMVFWTSGGANNPNQTPVPHNINVPLQNQMLHFTWYGVPDRYIKSSNSYIVNLLWRINQSDFAFWFKGALLYVNYNVERYTPPLTDEAIVGQALDYEKLCNVTFDWLWTTRDNDKADSLPTFPSSPHFTVAGHNLFPWWRDQRFYYMGQPSQTTVVGPPSPNQYAGQPQYRSFPFQLLFLDPDSIGAPTLAVVNA